MKIKHLRYWIEQTIHLSKLSNCVRRKFGCIIIDPVSNVLLVDGYNGATRGGSALCGGASTCLRETIKSGENVAIGCNHAEANTIANSARQGIRINNKWLIVNGEPCIMCAKLIKSAGIAHVIFVKDGYSSKAGIEYLKEANVRITSVSKDIHDDELRAILQYKNIVSRETHH